MNFAQIRWKSEDYQQTLELRDRLLRAPLGLSFDADDVAAEKGQLHFAMLDGKNVIACVVAVPINQGRVKLRQMAVQEDLQGSGVGRSLVEQVESVLVDRGFKTVELHARDIAVGFYEKLGYQTVGDPFEEVSIPHYKMVKVVSPLDDPT